MYGGTAMPIRANLRQITPKSTRGSPDTGICLLEAILILCVGDLLSTRVINYRRQNPESSDLIKPFVPSESLSFQ